MCTSISWVTQCDMLWSLSTFYRSLLTFYRSFLCVSEHTVFTYTHTLRTCLFVRHIYTPNFTWNAVLDVHTFAHIYHTWSSIYTHVTQGCWCIYAYTPKMLIYIYIYHTYVHVFAHIYTYLHVFSHTHHTNWCIHLIYWFIYAYITKIAPDTAVYSRICTCIHVFAGICTYLHVFARVCTYIHVFARIFTYAPHKLMQCTLISQGSLQSQWFYVSRIDIYMPLKYVTYVPHIHIRMYIYIP